MVTVYVDYNAYVQATTWTFGGSYSSPWWYIIQFLLLHLT